MGPFIYETGRPHMSEAALLAGTNPELEAAEAAQQRAAARRKNRHRTIQFDSVHWM